MTGMRLTQAASRSSTSVRANSAASASAGSVVRAMTYSALMADSPEFCRGGYIRGPNRTKVLYKGRTPFMASGPSPQAAAAPMRRPREQPKPADSPTRRKTLHLLLVFVTLVLVIDALVGEKGLLETTRARRRHHELTA